MDSATQVIANATGSIVAHAKRKDNGGVKRPKKLVKGSAATKRYMAYVRSMKKEGKNSPKTPSRKPVSRKTSKVSGKKSKKVSSSKPGSREEYKKLSMSKLNQLIKEGDKMAKDVRSRKLAVMTRKRQKTQRKKLLQRSLERRKK